MTSLPQARIIFAGGGTGGHLFPAVAIADRVKELLSGTAEANIIFVGTKRGIEYRLRETLDYPLHIINMRGVVRSLTLKNLLVPFVMLTALFRAWLLLRQFQPHLVVGTGGYVCWPVLKAASWKNITTVLQEQNSYPGVTTRQLAPKAARVYLGFEAARQFLPVNTPVIVTGNPVRTRLNEGERSSARQKFGLSPDKRTILILGGSQGARAINRAVIESLKAKPLENGYQLLWQTGKGDYKDVAVEAGNKVSEFALFPFAENMNEVYAAADVVIARAGALTLAEIIVCGLPSILIPYPHAAGDHQRKNAQDLAARGMAVVIDEKNLAEHDVLGKAVSLFSGSRYDAMRKALQEEEANRKPAVDMIAEDIIEILKKRIEVRGFVEDQHR